MLKAKKYDWKDSNMALFGSDTEKKVKKESAETEPAWQGAGAELGLQVWRINKFQVEHWPKEQYGEFFNGDSYIVLNTYKEEDGDELKYDVHFWIGKHSTQDEYGTAAYKTVELDTLLDDKPIQHREVQSHESGLFQTYFNAMTILKGGADTGFRRVLPEAYKPRLFHVENVARQTTSVCEISLKKGNINEDDVFILDCGERIYQYNGSKCSAKEKYKAAEHITVLKSERGGKPVTEILESEETPAEHPFWCNLKDGGPKDKTEEPEGERVLMVVSDADGSLDMDEVARGDAISKDLLKSEDVFVFCSGKHAFCWVGSEASVEERRNGLSYACSYLNKSETPWLPVSVVVEGNETKEFNCAF